MRQVIDGNTYDTASAHLLADDTFKVNKHRYTCGRATYLYRTQDGAYFAHHATIWHGERDRIELLSPPAAIALYKQLNDEEAVGFESAFPNIVAQEV